MGFCAFAGTFFGLALTRGFCVFAGTFFGLALTRGFCAFAGTFFGLVVAWCFGAFAVSRGAFASVRVHNTSRFSAALPARVAGLRPSDTGARRPYSGTRYAGLNGRDGAR